LTINCNTMGILSKTFCIACIGKLFQASRTD